MAYRGNIIFKRWFLLISFFLITISISATIKSPLSKSDNISGSDYFMFSEDSSFLPIIMINTLNQEIIQDSKIHAVMSIKYQGDGKFTHITDSSNIYYGDIGIDVRGASSAWYPQTPFNIETRTSSGLSNNVSLFGMPAENDWVLISNYNDRSLLRNTLAGRLFSSMGNYASRSKLCVVYLDSVYQGIYVFCEKLKRDKDRIDIAHLYTFENTGDDLTGGYILQQNLWDGKDGFVSNYSPIDHPGYEVHYLYEYPKTDSITLAQKRYIAQYVDTLEKVLYSPTFKNSQSGYRKYLDTKSFIDYFIVNEVARNIDGFKKSIFFSKDKNSNGGKLKAGPVWDFDWAWKNIDDCFLLANTSGSGWAHHINDCQPDNNSNGYYIRLLQDTSFANELRCTYEAYRKTVLDTAFIFRYIDSVEQQVRFDQESHFQKWQTLGVSGPAPEINTIPGTYGGELDYLKDWITKRLAWLDKNIPGKCNGGGSSGGSGTKYFSFYPNPSHSGIIHFDGSLNGMGPFQLSIFDVSGRVVKKMALATGRSTFDITLTSRGVYYFTVVDSGEVVQYGRILVL